MNIEFDSRGYPVSVFMKTGVVVITDVPPASAKPQATPMNVGGYSYYTWGPADNFPDTALELIEDEKGNPVLCRSLGMLIDIYCGQGIIPVRVTGYDALSKSEVYEVVPELIPMLSEPWVIDYISESLRDIKKLGNAFVQFRKSLDGKKIAQLTVMNARFCRLEYVEADPYPKGLITNSFPQAKADQTVQYPLVDSHDEKESINALAADSKIESFFMQLRDNFSNALYYASPTWLTAWTYINISQKLPKAISKGIDNVLNVTFVIQIPYIYWEHKYPESQYPDINVKMDLISKDIKALEDRFTTVDNARSTLVTHFGMDKEHPEADKWDIQVKEVKMPTEILENATAADSQIAIATGNHPDLLGLMYGNSKGGSMQREIFLLLYALSWRIRSRVLAPLLMMIRYNDPKYSDVQLRFINTFLTTLDSGGGTGKVLS